MIMFPSYLTEYINLLLEDFDLDNEEYINPMMIKSAIIRAAIDLKFNGVISKSLIEQILKSFHQII